MRSTSRVILGLLGGVFLLTASAQDTQQPVEIHFTSAVSWKEPGGTRVSYLSGDVRIRMGDMTLRADRVLGWTPPGEKQGFAFRELYAEGNIVQRTPEATVEAESLYFDIPKNRALILKFTLRSQDPKTKLPIVVRANEARKIGATLYSIEEAEVTSCTFGTPHYYVEVRRATLQVEPNQEQPPNKKEQHLDLRPPQGETTVHAEGMSVWAFGVPLLYFPGLSWTLGEEFLLRKLSAGRTSRFGYYELSDWGVPIKIDKKKWGDIILEADYRRVRGWAFGLDLDYNWANYEGSIDSYYLNDMGPNPHNSFDRRFLPLEREERWRVRSFHRHALSEQWRLELELSHLSDRNLLEEFFRKEFQQGKEQETVAYLRYLDGNVGGFLLERHRLNDFQTQIESMPRVSAWWLSEPLGLVHYSQVTDAANQRLMFDEDRPNRPFQTGRFDTLHEFFVPLDFETVQFEPFALGRFTAYENDLEGENEYRTALTGGLRARTMFWGVHPAKAFGMHGLRHVVELEANYANTVESTVHASELFQMDLTDGVDEFEELSLELRNRFETKLPQPDGTWKRHEFLNVGVEVEHYPDSDRDTGFRNANNTMYPFNWITVYPLPGQALQRRHWSNIHWDVTFTPQGVFSLSARGEWNPGESLEETRQVSASLGPIGPVSVSTSHYFLRNSSNSYAFTVTFQPTPKWRLTASTQYDFEREQFLSRQVTLERDLHDAVLQFIFEHSETRDEVRALVALQPKMLLGKKAPLGRQITR